jgi:hypothetical protein
MPEKDNKENKLKLGNPLAVFVDKRAPVWNAKWAKNPKGSKE